MNDKDSHHTTVNFDALLPPEMAVKAQGVGVKKANAPVLQAFVLAVLAGAFISLGACFATIVITGGGALPFGVTKMLGGLAFSLGLILVIVAGAELFTGNNLIVMAVAAGKISIGDLVKNWTIVFVGNLVGAIATAGFVFSTGQFQFADGEVGMTMLRIADQKCQLGFVQAIALGVLCNALVCLAVWLCMSARTTTDKILAIIFPVTAFVACGFEHSIANMYFIPTGLLVKMFAPMSFWEMVGSSAASFDGLTWVSFLIGNLLPVTIGNIIGGAGMVGLVYWFVYLRGEKA